MSSCTPYKQTMPLATLPGRTVGQAMVWTWCIALFCFGVIPHHCPGAPQDQAGGHDTGQTDISEVAETPAEEAAWEYRPYQVAVWVAHDNSYQLAVAEPAVVEGVVRHAAIIDPSGWTLLVARAPNPWNWRILSGFEKTQYVDELQQTLKRDRSTSRVDKLILVGLVHHRGLVNVTVQELDLKTATWGAEVKLTSSYNRLPNVVYDGIATAFMPLTRIERVMDKEVKVRPRAAGILNIADQDSEGQWTLKPNVHSPVWIGDDEIIMPILVRNDRRGNVDTIAPIDWTYLSIVDRDRSHLNCTTHAMRRSPLGGRTGGRTERMGLCVRAPNRPSILRLVSNEKDETSLQDLEVYSRRPGMDIEEHSEFLGKTNWRGEIEVTPNDDGLRILYVKSGQRVLARVPVVPGLYDKRTARMPNDEKRLYAEGIVRGLQNKLMDYVAQRQVYEVTINRLIEEGKFDEAEEELSHMRNITDSKTFNVTLSIEEKKLLSGDDRQKGFITEMFAELQKMSSEFLNADVEVELSRKIREAGNPSQ